MPNSEVKRCSADGSVGSPHVRVGNCQASIKALVLTNINRERIRGAVVQLVRIPACHAGGRGFESRPFRQLFRGVVQLVEHRSPKPGVGSSSLSAPASYQLSNNKIYTSL